TSPVGPQPYVLAANAATNKVYVSNTFSDQLTIIDGVTNAPRTLKTGSADAIAVDATGQHVYLLGYESDHFTVLDADDSLHRLPAGEMHLWALTLDGQDSLYVTRIANGDVVAMDLQSKSLTPIQAGQFPCAVAVHAQAAKVYVANCF